MIAEWMVYCAAVSAALGLAALSLEHALRRRGLPLRWVWAGALAGSVALSAAPWLRAPSAPADPGTVIEFQRTLDVGPSGGVMDSRLPAGGWSLRLLTVPRVPVPDSIVLAVWALVSTLAVSYLVATHRTLSRRRRFWKYSKVEGVPALISRDVGPAVVGFVDVAIVLPSWVLELDASQRRMVVAHEAEHVRARDPHVLAIALVALALMPWNLPLWWQVKRLRHAVELDCDSRVLRDGRDAGAYGELLINVGARAAAGRVGLAAFAESSSFLERRLRNLVAQRPRWWRTVGGLAGAAAVALAVYACEAPLPTSPEGAVSAAPTATPASASPQVAEAAASTSPPGPVPEAASEWEWPVDRWGRGEVREEPMRFEPASEEEAAEPQGPYWEDIGELVRRRHPEVLDAGLPLDRAVWFALDSEDRIAKSWVGPNLYLNFTTFQPMPELYLPEGSGARARAEEEHRQRESAILRDHVPGMRVRAIYAAHYYQPGFTVHFVTENAGDDTTVGRYEVANASVNAAVLKALAE